LSHTTPLALLWTAPALALYGLFALLPLAVALYLSCVRWNGLGQMVWVGTGNWLTLLSDGVALHAIYPILYMFISSLRTQEDFFQGANWYPPAHPTLQNYLNVFANDFGTYLMNSVFVTVLSVTLTVSISFFAAYAIARMQNRVTRAIFNIFLVGLAVPLQATIIPLYILIVNLHLYDTLYALILPYAAFSIPLSVLVLVTYLRDIPKELYQAMLLDGAGHRQIFARLVLPLSRPALMTIVIYDALHV
jgi:raffinose/stachyose/melibiose transport system permease protein